MSLERQSPVARLIERYGLNLDIPESLPVDIVHVAQQEGWEIVYRSGMANLSGFAVISGPVRVMTINADLDGPTQRFVVAHELSHAIHGDIDSLHLCRFSSWFTIKAERWASEAAAEMLIPDAALAYAGTTDELAALCDVPYEVAEMRLSGVRR